MSKRTKSMLRYEETGLRITDDAVIAHNAAGEIVGEYVRHRPPLDLWRRNGLRQTEYSAGQRYGALWREICQPQSPPYSDPTRIIVDGGQDSIGGSRDFSMDRDSPALAEAQRAIGDEETVGFLNRLCGLEDWPVGDKRRFKRICRKGLERLADHWRRR